MTEIPGWPACLGLRRYQILDSTNQEALRLARAGTRGPLWIVAREQSAGRGRRGRQWVSTPGNLFATLLTEAPPSIAAQLAFAAGLAAAETVAGFAPGAEVTLKWPNDVLLDGKKTAGLLLESAGEDALAIGVGINLGHRPEGTEFPANSVAAVRGRAPDPEDALLRLATRMAAWYEVWREHGFTTIRTAWLSRAAGLGQPIRARLEGSEMRGIFEGLDGDGALLLRDGSGALTRIAAGDVFFRT